MQSVGGNIYHLSLFKMLGAFECGCIDRHIAILRLWELLIQNYGIDASRIWATYFGGGKINGRKLPPDEDARVAWIEAGIEREKVIGMDANHSFWKQGRSTVGRMRASKCGEHTEIFFDLGEDLMCNEECKPGCTCGRFVELGGILFISYHMGDLPGILEPLPLPFTETVIGVERLAMLLQGVSSIFETNNLGDLVNLVASHTEDTNDERYVDADLSQRVIVDHLRAITFLATDGAPPPGKGGRRRLMRKLVRRTLTHMQLLGIAWDSNFLSEFLDVLVNLHNEIKRQGQSRALEFFELERQRFAKTLSATERRIDRLAQENKVRIAGHQVLDLVKKRGMPLPLVRVYCTEKGLTFNEQEYWSAHASWRKELGLE
jgi:alanyl-tRNA synthetase